MLINKIQDHININNNLTNKLTSDPHMLRMSVSNKKKLQSLITIGRGYALKHGETYILKSTDEKSDVFNNILLANVGKHLENKQNLEKAIDFMGEGEESQKSSKLLALEKMKLKESLLKLQSYSIQKKTLFVTSIEVKKADGLINATPDLLKMAPKPTVKPKKKPNLVLEKDLSPDVPEMDNQNVYVELNDQAVELELEAYAKRNFHLKEVTAQTQAMSLEGDVPRAIVTDLSFQQISGVVEAMQARVNTHVKTQTSTATNRTNKKGTSLKTIKIPQALPNDKLDRLNLRHAKMKAKQKSQVIAKKMMSGQEQHNNYIDVEHFELDKVQSPNSVYEAGARNPLSGRLFSVKVKTIHSDLRKDDRYKRRTI